MIIALLLIQSHDSLVLIFYRNKNIHIYEVNISNVKFNGKVISLHHPEGLSICLFRY